MHKALLHSLQIEFMIDVHLTSRKSVAVLLRSKYDLDGDGGKPHNIAATVWVNLWLVNRVSVEFSVEYRTQQHLSISSSTPTPAPPSQAQTLYH